ncbi:MAG: hypothetical protein QXM76_05115 [Zestosphaera sp.]
MYDVVFICVSVVFTVLGFLITRLDYSVTAHMLGAIFSITAAVEMARVGYDFYSYVVGGIALINIVYIIMRAVTVLMKAVRWWE